MIIMDFTEEKVNVLLNKWKKILNLKDWSIKSVLVERQWRKTGDIKIYREDKKAILMINKFNPKVENLEEVIIHELVYLKLWSMDQMIENLIYNVFGDDEKDSKFQFAYNQFTVTLEETVEDITKSLLYLGGEDKNLSFGKVRKLVDDELNKLY